MDIIADIRQAIAQSPDGIAHFEDPRTGERFVAMREIDRDRFRRILAGEVASGELVDAVMREDDENDASLGAYQQFRRQL